VDLFFAGSKIFQRRYCIGGGKREGKGQRRECLLEMNSAARIDDRCGSRRAPQDSAGDTVGLPDDEVTASGIIGSSTGRVIQEEVGNSANR